MILKSASSAAADEERALVLVATTCRVPLRSLAGWQGRLRAVGYGMTYVARFSLA